MSQSSDKPLKPPAILLMGDPGSGKTWSVATFAKAEPPVDVFLLALDNTSVASARKAFDHWGLPQSRLHTNYCPAADVGFDTLAARSGLLNSQTFESISNMKSGMLREKTNQIKNMWAAMLNFKCDCCGKDHGPIATFGDDKAFILDSLSTLNAMVRNNFMGLKSAMAQGEWGVIMDEEEMLLKMLCSKLECYTVILAHTTREKDDTTGGVKISPNALGSKLGPNLGQYFDECIMSKRTTMGYLWTNVEPNSTTFNRSLPQGKDLDPSFVPVVEGYRRAKLAEQQAATATAGEPTETPMVPSTPAAT